MHPSDKAFTFRELDKGRPGTGRTARAKKQKMTASRSKSIDFTELLQYSHSHPRPSLPQLGSEPLKAKTGGNLEAIAECDDHEVNGERFGIVLGLSSLIKSPTASAKRFTLEGKQKLGTFSSSAEGKYSALKRVFSMRRSASVYERYCRIHNQSTAPWANFDDEDCLDKGMESPQKPVEQHQHKGGKIIKACKRFFSLK